MSDPFLIGEIGINHNGDLKLAKKLIDYSSEAGFNAVKFQKRTIDKVYPSNFLAEPRESPFGTTQRDQKEGLEFGFEEYKEIDSYCKSKNILWSASAWDTESQSFLEGFDIAFNKVASPVLNNKKLLNQIAAEGRYTYISTGMSTLDELDEVVEIFRTRDCPFELMHTVSQYPLPQSEANLLTIKTLQERYRCNVGYSGHETCLIKVSLLAVALGATSVERHITLDRAMYGSDQACSIEARSLKDFAQAMRNVDNILGSGNKVITPSEAAVRSKLRDFSH